ncbi:MAG: 50S ribosomal protein L6 [Campylobacterota bacterium]
MSRIGKRPVAIAKGIDCKVEGTKLIVTKGKISEELETHGRVNLEVADNVVTFGLKSDEKQSRAYWGTYRALFNNIIEGLDKGFTKTLEFTGVGYRAQVKGDVLNLQLGFSHDINYEIPQHIEIAVEKNTITVKGHSKQQVGQVAAEIREFRPPEPYKGKGVKYADEVIIRKAGKAAGS